MLHIRNLLLTFLELVNFIAICAVINFFNIFTKDLVITSFLSKQILSMLFWKQFKSIIILIMCYNIFIGIICIIIQNK
jgi:hypothetical protein